MHAEFWRKSEDGSVICELCFRNCRISKGTAGFCGVRQNQNAELISPMLGKFCAVAVDPIEKKPLFHWRPGSWIFSLGSLGCTMNCPFCQNHRIAKPSIETADNHIIKQVGTVNHNYSTSGGTPCVSISPNELTQKILDANLNSVAFTYNEPTLQTEYICECAQKFHDANIAIVLVTNGAMSSGACEKLIASLKLTGGAANIDIKAFNAESYARLGGSLEAVKANIKSFVQSEIHTELTSLIVPSLNDDAEKFSEMVEWINAISPDIPLHVTRYFPARSFHEPPTDLELLYSLASIAKNKLKYVHVGNV